SRSPTAGTAWAPGPLARPPVPSGRRDPCGGRAPGSPGATGAAHPSPPPRPPPPSTPVTSTPSTGPAEVAANAPDGSGGGWEPGETELVVAFGAILAAGCLALARWRGPRPRGRLAPGRDAHRHGRGHRHGCARRRVLCRGPLGGAAAGPVEVAQQADLGPVVDELALLVQEGVHERVVPAQPHPRGVPAPPGVRP